MESKKKEAMKARKTALERMEMKDFTSARKFALTAQQLYHDLDKIEQVIMVCDVHSSAGREDKKDWYRIIGVDPTADMAAVKSQCQRLALGLHPDKNAAPGAAEAFQLVMEAKEVLLDYEKRSLYDSVRARVSDSNDLAPIFRNNMNLKVKKKDEVAKKDDKVAVNYSPFTAIAVGKIAKEGIKEGKSVFQNNMNLKLKKKDEGAKKDDEVAGNYSSITTIAEGKTAKEGIKEGELSGVRVSEWNNRVSAFQIDHKKPIPAKRDDELVVNNCSFTAIAKAKEAVTKGKLVVTPSPPKLKVYTSRGRKGKTVKEGSRDSKPVLFSEDKTEKKGKMAEIPSTPELKVYASRGRKGKIVKEGSGGSKRVLFSEDKNYTESKSAASLPPKYKEGVKRVKLSQLEGNIKNLEYSDAQFNDFERERSKESFSKGQIWAVYDTIDAMPRFYALINNVVVSEDFKVQITWLEPIPESLDENRWLSEGLPTSFGKFRLGDSQTIEDHGIFSHLVLWKKSGILGNLYEIYPKKGETWAIFKNWGFDDWIMDKGKLKVCGFEVVEVLTDYFGELGVRVRVLSRIKGVFSGFRRKEGEGVDWEVIHGKNRFRFSHQIPSFAVTMLEGSNVVKNFFELDPASLPSNV